MSHTQEVVWQHCWSVKALPVAGPVVSVAEIPGSEGLAGFCYCTTFPLPTHTHLCSPKAGPSLQEAGRGCCLYEITGCEQRTVRNWNEITKSFWFIWDLSLGLLGESECINPLWELIPCLVIIQASLKYALCWRSNQITLKNLEWEKCWVFFTSLSVWLSQCLAIYIVPVTVACHSINKGMLQISYYFNGINVLHLGEKKIISLWKITG